MVGTSTVPCACRRFFILYFISFHHHIMPYITSSDESDYRSSDDSSEEVGKLRMFVCMYVCACMWVTSTKY